MHNVLRRGALVVAYFFSFLLIAWSLPAMFVGIFHVGSLLPCGIGVLLAAGLMNRRTLAALTGARRVLLHLAGVGFCCFLGAFVVASGFMIQAACRPAQPDSTVIVAGAQVHGTTPSLSLRCRLDAAAEYLQEHPNSPCIVSGGQGEGEELPEAEAMAAYLIEYGIDEDRIYVENRSLNTSQNMCYSAEMIRRQGLPEKVSVVTDAFHQLRCQMFAEKNGLTPGAVVSDTPWYLQQCYWWREIFGLAKAIVFES